MNLVELGLGAKMLVELGLVAEYVVVVYGSGDEVGAVV